MTTDRPDVRYAFGFGALWAAEEALTGLLMPRYGLAQVVWMRFVFHTLLVLLIWGRGDMAALFRTRRPWLHAARAVALLAMPACWALGTRQGLAPATLMSVFWLAPLLILAIARLALGERASRKVWVATTLASVGVFVMTGPHELPAVGLFAFPIGMACAFSVFLVLTRVLRDEPEQVGMMYLGITISLLLLPLMPRSWVMPQALDLAVVLVIALVSLGALLAMGRLTSASRLSRSAPMAYLQIPFAMGIGWSLGSHQPDWRSNAGLLVVLLSVLLAWRCAARVGEEPAGGSALVRPESRL